MKTLIGTRKPVLGLFAVAVVAGILAATACGSDGEDAATPTERATSITLQITTAEPAATGVEPTTEVEPTPTGQTPDGQNNDGQSTGDGSGLNANNATITVDGDTSDWDGIEPLTVLMEQIRMEGLDPSAADDIEFDSLPPIDVSLRIAADAENIYLLMEVPDDYNFDPEDGDLSAAIAIQFRIDAPAAVHMGSEVDDLDTSLGLVDMWHWELDCGPGQLSGGQGVTGGDDSACNLDDEYASTAEDREDDGEGDTENPNAENSLTGVWEHTARADGPDADGTWIFEMSRPLQTGDPQDVQFAGGGTASIALAYWDPDETVVGWSDVGHLTSSYAGWIEVTVP